MSARRDCLEQQMRQQREQQQRALAAVSSCLSAAIAATHNGHQHTDSNNTPQPSLSYSVPQQPPAPPPAASASPSSSTIAEPLSSASLSLSAASFSASSSSSARLSDLCAADKAKVGCLLVKVAELQQQRGAAGAALEAETRRLREEKDETERRLSHSLQLLKQYQDRLRIVELQAEAERRREKQEDATAAPSSPQRQGADKLAASQAELLQLLREQQKAVTRKLLSLAPATSAATPSFVPGTESGRDLRQVRSQQRGQHGLLPASLTVQTSTSTCLPAASSSSSKSPAAPTRHTASRHLTHRRSPITVSVRYVRRAASNPSSPQPPHSHRPVRPSSTVDARIEKKRPEQAEDSAQLQAADDEEEEEEEASLSRSSSPVSRRIQRLMDIQQGHQLQRTPAVTEPSLSSSSRLHRSNPSPLPSTTRRPQPPPPGFSSSHPSSSSIAATAAGVLDAETEQLILSLNGSSSRVSRQQPQRLLSSLDVSLLRSLNPIQS